jgi:amidase
MNTFTPAVELAAAIRRQELSPVELLDECLAQVDLLNPTLNAVIWRDDEGARKNASRLADRVASGDEPLPAFAGVPLPIKDLTAVEGWPVTYGSNGASGAPSSEDELVVAALRKAGFVLTGRTNTPELGPISVTENVRYGITRNPWNPERTPGGSSGGAAAAVASGMFPLAHGNDGGGSVRIPASCCGLVGLKVSRFRVPALVPNWMGASVEGVLVRTVADTAAVLDQICGPDPLGWANAPVPDRPFAAEVGADPGRLRIAVLTRAMLDLPVDEEIREGVTRTAALLEGLGHHVEELDFELFSPDLLADFLPVVNTGYAEYPDVDFTKVEPHNRAGYEAARSVDSIAFVQALRRLQRATRDPVARWGRDFDLLLTPTMTITPPKAGSVLTYLETHPDVAAPDVLAMAAFTAPFNVSGQPAISLPLHESKGLPVGMQLVAGPWQESMLIRVSAQLEEAAPWAARRPTVATAEAS